MDKLENVELEAMIKKKASELNIAPYPLDEVKKKVKGYYDSKVTYVTSAWRIWYDSYIEACIVWSLNDIRKENPIENQLYLDLERYANSVGESVNRRILKIIEWLSAKKIFLRNEKYVFTLHQVLKWLTLEQCERVKKCIIVLKDYCDAIGICSILEGTNFHCSGGISHGQETLKEAIAKSCNTYFVDLSRKINPEKLLGMSKAFGLGEKICIADNFETEAGELPALKDLSSAYEFANLSFGQGDLLATPVQISGVINAIASGGEYAKPTLVEGLVNENRQYIKRSKIEFNRVISQKTAAYLRSCMVESVESGTSVNGKPDTGGAGAKTATAETGIKKDDHFIYQTWFAGFFPKEHPKYSVVVFVENGESGGTTCAPIFKFIADKLNALKS